MCMYSHFDILISFDFAFYDNGLKFRKVSNKVILSLTLTSLERNFRKLHFFC